MEVNQPGGNGGGASIPFVETPIGLIDGVNTVYSVLNPIQAVYTLDINGQYIHPSEYVVAGSGFTMNTALPASLAGTGFTIVYV